MAIDIGGGLGSDVTGMRVTIDPRLAEQGANIVNRAFDTMPDHADSAARRIDTAMSRVRKSLFGLQGAFAGMGIGLFAHEVLRADVTMAKIINTLQTATGSAAMARVTFREVRAASKELAIDLGTAANAYARLRAATRGTNTEGAATEKLFRGVSAAVTATGGGAYELYLALKAVEQMASKGRIQMEELRGQLGDVVPGAFNLVAQSIGKTTTELNKLMKVGLAADDVLPKMGEHFIKVFEGPAKIAGQSIIGVLNRWKTFKLELLTGVGMQGFADALSKTIGKFEKLLDNKDFMRAATNIGNLLGSAINKVADIVMYLGNHINYVRGAFIAFMASKIIGFFTELATAIKSVQAALIGMNVAAAASPLLKPPGGGGIGGAAIGLGPIGPGGGTGGAAAAAAVAGGAAGGAKGGLAQLALMYPYLFDKSGKLLSKPALATRVAAPDFNAPFGGTRIDPQRALLMAQLLTNKQGELLNQGALNARLSGSAYQGFSALERDRFAAMAKEVGLKVPLFTSMFGQSFGQVRGNARTGLQRIGSFFSRPKSAFNTSKIYSEFDADSIYEQGKGSPLSQIATDQGIKIDENGVLTLKKPITVFHGTTKDRVESILKNGLMPPAMIPGSKNQNPLLYLGDREMAEDRARSSVTQGPNAAARMAVTLPAGTKIGEPAWGHGIVTQTPISPENILLMEKGYEFKNGQWTLTQPRGPFKYRSAFSDKIHNLGRRVLPFLRDESTTGIPFRGKSADYFRGMPFNMADYEDIEEVFKSGGEVSALTSKVTPRQQRIFGWLNRNLRQGYTFNRGKKQIDILNNTVGRGSFFTPSDVNIALGQNARGIEGLPFNADSTITHEVGHAMDIGFIEKSPDVKAIRSKVPLSPAEALKRVERLKERRLLDPKTLSRLTARGYTPFQLQLITRAQDEFEQKFAEMPNRDFQELGRQLRKTRSTDPRLLPKGLQDKYLSAYAFYNNETNPGMKLWGIKPNQQMLSGGMAKDAWAEYWAEAFANSQVMPGRTRRMAPASFSAAQSLFRQRWWNEGNETKAMEFLTNKSGNILTQPQLNVKLQGKAFEEMGLGARLAVKDMAKLAGLQVEYKKVLEGTVPTLRQFSRALISKDTWASAASGVAGFGTKITASIKGAFDQVLKSARTGAKNTASVWTSIISNLNWSNVKSGSSQAFDFIKISGLKAFDGVKLVGNRAFQGLTASSNLLKRAFVGLVEGAGGLIASLSGVLAANPFMAVLAGVAGLYVAYETLKDKTLTIAGHTATLRQHLLGWADVIKAGLQDIIDQLDSILDKIGKIKLPGTEPGGITGGTVGGAAKFYAGTVTKFLGNIASFGTLTNPFGLNFGPYFKGGLVGTAGAMAEERNRKEFLQENEGYFDPITLQKKALNPFQLPPGWDQKFNLKNKRLDLGGEIKENEVARAIAKLKEEIAGQDKIIKMMVDISPEALLTSKSTQLKKMEADLEARGRLAAIDTKETPKGVRPVTNQQRQEFIRLSNLKAEKENYLTAGKSLADMIVSMNDELKAQEAVNAAMGQGSYAMERAKSEAQHKIQIDKILNGLTADGKDELKAYVIALDELKKKLEGATQQEKIYSDAVQANMELPWNMLRNELAKLTEQEQLVSSNGKKVLEPLAAWFKKQNLVETYKQQLDQMLMATKKFAAGAFVAFRQYADYAKNAATQAYEFISNSLRSMEDAFTQFLSGKGLTGFKNMFSQMWQDANRAAVRHFITGPLADKLSKKFGTDFGLVKADGSKEAPFYVRDVDKFNKSVIGKDGMGGLLDILFGKKKQKTENEKDGQGLEIPYSIYDIYKLGQKKDGENGDSESTNESLKNTGEEIKKIFSGLKDGLLKIFKGIGTLLSKFGSAIWTGLKTVGSWFGGLFKFEGGGIMTSRGPLPLRKYASGGVAFSPQLAMYGEGITPEAFVPLPDGRRIPVSIRGGGYGMTQPINIKISRDLATQVEVERIDSSTVRIIARQEAMSTLNSHGPRVIANDLQNPNSPTSKAVVRTKDTRERR